MTAAGTISGYTIRQPQASEHTAAELLQ